MEAREYLNKSVDLQQWCKGMQKEQECADEVALWPASRVPPHPIIILSQAPDGRLWWTKLGLHFPGTAVSLFVNKAHFEIVVPKMVFLS